MNHVRRASRRDRSEEREEKRKKKEEVILTLGRKYSIGLGYYLGSFVHI
jgi:hypothetical protein